MIYEVVGYINSNGVSNVIPEACFQATKSAKQTCLLALEIEEKLSLLIDNFVEYETELLRLAQSFIVWTEREHGEAMMERLMLDRRLVNLLTSCRLYLDQSDSIVSELFGNPSDELQSIKKFKNALYDSHWGYRLMEAIRNHVQHRRLAVHIISHYSGKVKTGQTDHVERIVIPQTSVSDLSENGRFKKSVLQDLKSRGDCVDLRLPIREYVDCFVELHLKIRELLQPKPLAHRTLYESAVKDLALIKNEQIEFPELVMRMVDGEYQDRVPLVTEFLNHFDWLFRKNSINKQLRSYFASNRLK